MLKAGLIGYGYWGPNLARNFSELGAPAAQFPSAAALASYVGVVPATWQSGRQAVRHAGISPLGHVSHTL